MNIAYVVKNNELEAIVCFSDADALENFFEHCRQVASFASIFFEEFSDEEIKAVKADAVKLFINTCNEMRKDTQKFAMNEYGCCFRVDPCTLSLFQSMYHVMVMAGMSYLALEKQAADAAVDAFKRQISSIKESLCAAQALASLPPSPVLS